MPTRTRRSQPRQGPTRPIPEDFSGEVLPSRSSNRPVRSRWRSGQSDIMPSSTKFSQTRYAAAARPPQARPRAHTHASARAPRRRAAPTACRRPPPRALAARRAVRRRAARARPRRARRPRALARESRRRTAARRRPSRPTWRHSPRRAAACAMSPRHLIDRGGADALGVRVRRRADRRRDIAQRARVRRRSASCRRRPTSAYGSVIRPVLTLCAARRPLSMR